MCNFGWCCLCQMNRNCKKPWVFFIFLNFVKPLLAKSSKMKKNEEKMKKHEENSRFFFIFDHFSSFCNFGWCCLCPNEYFIWYLKSSLFLHNYGIWKSSFFSSYGIWKSSFFFTRYLEIFISYFFFICYLEIFIFSSYGIWKSSFFFTRYLEIFISYFFFIWYLEIFIFSSRGIWKSSFFLHAVSGGSSFFLHGTFGNLDFFFTRHLEIFKVQLYSHSQDCKRTAAQ